MCNCLACKIRRGWLTYEQSKWGMNDAIRQELQDALRAHNKFVPPPLPRFEKKPYKYIPNKSAPAALVAALEPNLRPA
jgi:hypothetical protein